MKLYQLVEARIPGGSCLAIDLAEVEELDAAAVATLVETRRLLGTSGRLVLANVSPRIYNTVNYARAASVLTMWPDFHGGVERFAAGCRQIHP